MLCQRGRYPKDKAAVSLKPVSPAGSSYSRFVRFCLELNVTQNLSEILPTFRDLSNAAQSAMRLRIKVVHAITAT